jgi:hypothetical protein
MVQWYPYHPVAWGQKKGQQGLFYEGLGDLYFDAFSFWFGV